MAASQVTPNVPPVAPAGTGAGLTAPPTGDQDWNITATTTTHDWAEDGGDWSTTEPKVGPSDIIIRCPILGYTSVCNNSTQMFQ